MGPSGGPSALHSGPSGGQNQNKTSSSKNTGNVKHKKNLSTREFQSFDLRASKRNNFMDEFDKFEEQVEKSIERSHPSEKSKIKVNKNSKKNENSFKSSENAPGSFQKNSAQHPQQSDINNQYSSYMKDF